GCCSRKTKAGERVAPPAFYLETWIRSVGGGVRSGDEFSFDRGGARPAGFSGAAIIGDTGDRSLGGSFLFLNISQPGPRRRTLAGSNLEEDFLNLLGDFTASPRTNLNPIDRTNRRNLGGGAAEEKFISHVQRGALNG